MYDLFRTLFLTPREFCSEKGIPLFNEYRERVVEIGFGNGDFLVHLSESLGRDTLVLGLEVSAVCALKATKKLAQKKILNTRVILGDARYILDNSIPEGSLATIFMNFPCPWPKTRHSSRRVTYGRFPEILSKVLKQKGEFRLVTDEEWYVNEVKRNLLTDPCLEFVSLEIDPVLEISTKYSMKWKAMGKKAFRLTFRNIRGLSGVACENVKESMPMHRKVPLAGDIASARNNAEKLVAGSGANGKHHWAFKSIYWSSEGNALLKTITSDDGFEQTFFYRLVFSEGELLVKLEDAGAPLHTPSVTMAMEFISKHYGEHSS